MHHVLPLFLYETNFVVICRSQPTDLLISFLLCFKTSSSAQSFEWKWSLPSHSLFGKIKLIFHLKWSVDRECLQRRRQREHHQTKGLIRKMAVRVRYISLYISLPSSEKQQIEMFIYTMWRINKNSDKFGNDYLEWPISAQALAQFSENEGKWRRGCNESTQSVIVFVREYCKKKLFWKYILNNKERLHFRMSWKSFSFIQVEF